MPFFIKWPEKKTIVDLQVYQSHTQSVKLDVVSFDIKHQISFHVLSNTLQAAAFVKVNVTHSLLGLNVYRQRAAAARM